MGHNDYAYFPLLSLWAEDESYVKDQYEKSKFSSSLKYLIKNYVKNIDLSLIVSIMKIESFIVNSLHKKLYNFYLMIRNLLGFSKSYFFHILLF